MSKFRPALAFLLAVSIFGLIQPVKILAQVVRVDATEDSSVNEEAKDSNMNSQSKLSVGVDLQGTAHNRAYSFVRFGSSLNLPPGTEISKANLVIYLEHATGLPTVALRISRITSNWHESILTWNTQPTFADGVTVSVNSTSETKKFDITDFVKYWKANPAKNFGIQIAGIINNQPYMRTFSDRSGRNLYLEITYYNPADRTPPTISNVKVDPSKTTARILWVTNKLLKEASVEYGLSATFGKKASAISTQSTSLQVNLTGLKTPAPYFYKIKSVDFAGNQTTKTGTFNTLGSADGPSVSPPKFTADSKNIFNSVVTKTSITNLQATEITYKSALITWDTNIPTNSRVDYGKGQRTLDKQKTSTALLTRHSVRIEGLSASTRYYYMVKSGAPNAQSATFPTGDPQVFVTGQPTAAQAAADAAAAAQMGREIGQEIAEDLSNLGNSFGTTQTPLVIYHPKVDDITPNSAVARWVTNKPATSEVFYWQPGFFAKSIGNTAHTTNHAITLSNLQPNSRYNYLFRSKTNQGESIISPDAYFISGFLNSSADPLAIQGLNNPIFTHTEIVFIWTTNKPADELLVLTDMVTNDAVSKEDHTFQTQHTQTFDPADLNPDSVYALKLTVKTEIGETKIVTSQFRSLTPLGSGTYPPVGSDTLPTLPEGQDQIFDGEEITESDQGFIDPNQIQETAGQEEPLITDQEPAAGASEPVVDTKPILTIPNGSVLSGIISRIPIIGKLLGADAGTDVSAPKPDLTKILLIVVVIILILVLLSKKRTPKVDAVPLETNKSETPPTVEPKPKKRNWLVIIILLILAVFFIQSLGFFLNPAMLLAPFMSQVLDKNLPTANKEVQTSSYIIKQTDNIPYSLNITGIGKATGESTIISDGVVIKPGSGFGWQGDWQVVQNTTSSGQFFNQINLKGFTSSGVSSNAKTKDLTMLLFSLEGVAVGSEFPLYIVRIGAYEEDISGPTQDVIFSLNNQIFGTGRIKPDSKTISRSSKGGLQVKAKLVESYGKDGALISYGGGMSSIAGQQGEAIEQIGKMAQADPTLKRIYDEMMAQSSAEIKLKIIPSGI